MWTLPPASQTMAREFNIHKKYISNSIYNRTIYMQRNRYWVFLRTRTARSDEDNQLPPKQRLELSNQTYIFTKNVEVITMYNSILYWITQRVTHPSSPV